jgi:hypothetical protein
MAKKKTKRFDDGGVVANSNYPFGQGQVPSSSGSSSSGLGNNSPLVQVNSGATDTSQVLATPAATSAATSATTPVQMKKGGAVSAPSRGDGIAQRGKTKGRMC